MINGVFSAIDHGRMARRFSGSQMLIQQGCEVVFDMVSSLLRSLFQKKPRAAVSTIQQRGYGHSHKLFFSREKNNKRKREREKMLGILLVCYYRILPSLKSVSRRDFFFLLRLFLHPKEWKNEEVFFIFL